MAEAWIASFLAFFAGAIVGIALGKWRWGHDASPGNPSGPDAPGTACRSWNETMLVDTRTGRYFFASEYLKCHSRMDLFGELANGHFAHEEKWDNEKGVRK